MIPQVKWAEHSQKEYISPFQRGIKERPLRITLHTETLNDLPDEESRALAALHDLATLSGIEIAQTTSGPFPRLVLNPVLEVQDTYRARVWRGAEILRSGWSRVDTKADFPVAVEELAALENPESPDTEGVRRELLLGVAHMAVGHDIVVTTSVLLLRFRNRRHYLMRHRTLAGINPRLPSEALRIVALFLRSRDEYRPRDNTHEIPRIGVWRSRFYIVLVYERLPNAWLYESACGRARLSDDTYQLSKSVAIRCMRALEARDALGQLFYMPNYDSIGDRTAYHFDYFLLVLSGAFDVLARVAHRVYKIKKVQERFAGFRREDFRNELKMLGALDLEQLASSQRVHDILSILGDLRNNIHGAVIQARRGHSFVNLNTAAIEVPDYQAADIWERIVRLGKPARWGIRKQHPTSSWQVQPFSIQIEPYTFVTKVLEECLPIINDIMGKTEVTRLLPAGVSTADLYTEPKDDNTFPRKLRHDIAFLG